MHLFFRQYGAGFPLIVLHGFLGASGNWHSLAKNAFAEHFNVFTPDLRNHGESPHSDQFDFPSLVSDVEKFCADHGLKQVDIIGHSMGGKVAMFLALQRQALVRRLVVVDTPPRKLAPVHVESLLALRRLNLGGIGTRKDADRELATDVPSARIRDFLLRNLRFTGDGRYEWKINLDALTTHYANILEAVPFGQFDGPALFVKGDQSAYLHTSDWPEIRMRFPDARLAVIPGAGHWVHADQPEAFADVVVSFLQAERY